MGRRRKGQAHKPRGHIQDKTKNKEGTSTSIRASAFKYTENPSHAPALTLISTRTEPNNQLEWHATEIEFVCRRKGGGGGGRPVRHHFGGFENKLSCCLGLFITGTSGRSATFVGGRSCPAASRARPCSASRAPWRRAGRGGGARRRGRASVCVCFFFFCGGGMNVSGFARDRQSMT